MLKKDSHVSSSFCIESAKQNPGNQEGFDPGFKALPSRSATARYNIGVVLSISSFG